MDSSILNDTRFDECRSWVKKRKNQGVSWEKLLLAGKKDEAGLADFIESRIEEDFWPQELNTDLWQEMIRLLQEAESRKIAQDGHPAIIVSNPHEISRITVPEDERSSWQLYKEHLVKQKFSERAIENIEESTHRILKQLSQNTVKSGPVKGLVVGNVQSGKTANMAGLMAMAADWGWNMFIILSGTIESLRKQTQNRLFNDLKHTGNIVWIQLDHLSKKSPVGQRMSELDFSKDTLARYMTVCLKNQARLQNLIEWIEADKRNIQNLKVLVIDDEADQAGVSTGDVYTDSERKTISRLILNLVQCRDKKAINNETNTYDSHYQAMNYISYTATPYANCLNENGDNTLYPKNFIHTLSLSQSYFGPQRIFGMYNEEEDNRLNIVNEIPIDDVDIIKDIQDNDTRVLPASMKEAICWFIAASAFMRYHGYKKPVSMLIHTSQKQEHHANVANAVKKWLEHSRDEVESLCKKIYHDQKQKLTIKLLRKAYPDYEHPDSEIWAYPDYADLRRYVSELLSKISHIRMDDDGELQYTKGLHICVDNCSANGVDEDGMHLRLAYPDKQRDTVPDFATAFIVIGGNTLSRGLTLEGLVSTFFLRSVKQADTLMQMGRWFGYRPHYELLPRIWMTEDCREKFEYLTEVDSDLREQIYQMMVAGQTPDDFNLALMLSPKVSWMSLTAKSKMQMAEAAGVDFSGMDTQLTVYSRNVADLRNNLEVTSSFLSGLEQPRKSETAEAYIWDDIPFTQIKERLFDAGFKVAETSKAFQQMDLLNEWIQAQTQNGYLTEWNVAACGIKTAGLPENKLWHICGEAVTGKVTRTCKTDMGDHFNIGVLTSKKDYIADIRRDMADDALWTRMIDGSEINTEYRTYRAEAHAANKPLLLIYIIDKDSQPRKDSGRTALKVQEDLVGIAMVVPGIRGRHSAVTRVKIRKMDEPQEV